jgi:hypothetical protein
MMHSANEYRGLVLAVHPTSRGIGWVLFEDAQTIFDWGCLTARQSDARQLAKFERILDRRNPSVVIFETFDARCERIHELFRQMAHLATFRGMNIAVYEESDVRAALNVSATATRHEVARLVAERIPALSHYLPPKRRSYDGESRTQAIFDAAALALTYFARTAPP